MQILKGLTPREKRLRAFLNRSEHLRSFSGKKLILDGERSEVDLARYAATWAAIASSARIEVDQFGIISDEVAKHKIEPYFISLEEAVTAVEHCKSSLGRKGVVINPEGDNILGLFTAAETYSKLISAIFLGEIDSMAANLATSDPEGIVDQKWAGLLKKMVVGRLLEIHGRCKEDISFKGDEQKAFLLLGAILATEYDTQDIRVREERLKFSRKEQAAYRRIKKMFMHLNVGFLSEVMEDLGTEHSLECLTFLDYLYLVHKTFGFRQGMEIEGAGFMVEGSPFCRKPVGEVRGNFDLAIYPTDEEVVGFLKLIKDPSFTHADGAIGLASLYVKSNVVDQYVRVMELQTDVISLIRRNKIRLPDRIESSVKRWMEITLAAVKEFAKRAGVKEVYAETPFSIFREYGLAIPPFKVKQIYFNFMERSGGELVFDDLGELDQVKQHYWRIPV
ncbi:hypothetical protein HZC08_00905 [Candidatus Micrarchaeota archaeon]|nr:hypothetical protein [Candidatus Micrarchaeota archaeon]